MKKKSVAIIGAGFAGLALAYELSRDCAVTVYDAVGIGGGASGSAIGLLHPYPPMKKRQPIWRAREALAAAEDLLERVGSALFSRSGIERLFEDKELADHFFAQNLGDVERISDLRFLVKSGIVVDSPRYLDGLWTLCEKQGATLKIQKISTIQQLSGYDEVVFAAGFGMVDLFTQLDLRYSKGQALRVSLKTPLPRPIMAFGYLAPAGSDYWLGATYELRTRDGAADMQKACELLLPRLASMGAELNEVKGVTAGMRVLRNGNYHPMVDQLADGLWIFTALGSRGLLYHAYLAKLLAAAIRAGNPSLLPKELLVKEGKKG